LHRLLVPLAAFVEATVFDNTRIADDASLIEPLPGLGGRLAVDCGNKRFFD
jgi:hypothetical protein